MTLVVLLIALIVALRLVMRFSESRYRPSSQEDEIHFVTPSDGWRLALHRYLPKGGTPHGEPVLLHHGLAGNHSNFDMGLDSPGAPVPSMARWLAEQGYEVWCCDLRGQGDSERPSLGNGKRWGWCLDDHIEKDDPAFVDYILARSDYENLHWIGHSMGGLLLLCHCALHGSPCVASGIGIGSGIDFGGSESQMRSLAPLARVAGWIPRVPMNVLSKLSAPLAGRWGLGFERVTYCPENMAPKAARSMIGGSNGDISGKLLLQLATLFQPGGLRSMDGRISYSDRAKGIQTPCLMIEGDRDQLCPPMAGTRTLECLSGDQHGMLTIGKEYGHKEHYGHADLLAGLNADEEVFPCILQWLQDHPATKKSP